LLGEGYPRPLLAGIAVSFVGVTVIALGGSGGHGDGLGIVLGLGTAVLYAAGILAQKVALRATDPLTATWLGCVLGTVVLLPYTPGAVDELTRAPATAVAAVGYLGIFPTAVGFALWAFALTRSDAGKLASTTLAVPGIVVVMSWVTLGELPTVFGLVGGVMCLAGVTLAQRRSVSRSTVAVPGRVRPARRGRRARRAAR
jgi:drug/metabolite transporter (DMT)-like permease